MVVSLSIGLERSRRKVWALTALTFKSDTHPGLSCPRIVNAVDGEQAALWTKSLCLYG